MNPVIIVVALALAFATALFTTPYVRRLALTSACSTSRASGACTTCPSRASAASRVYLGFAFALFSALGYLIAKISVRQARQPARPIGLIFGGTLILRRGHLGRRDGDASSRQTVAQILVAGISMLYGFTILPYVTNPFHHGPTDLIAGSGSG